VLKFVLVLSTLTALVGLARGRSGADMFDAAVALAANRLDPLLSGTRTIPHV
jgi:hypothetical protein